MALITLILMKSIPLILLENIDIEAAVHHMTVDKLSKLKGMRTVN